MTSLLRSITRSHPLHSALHSNKIILTSSRHFRSTIPSQNTDKPTDNRTSASTTTTTNTTAAEIGAQTATLNAEQGKKKPKNFM